MDTITAKAESIVRAAPSAVFHAFADPDQMSKFWFTRRDDGLKEGESMSWFVGSAKEAYAIDVRVIEIKEPEVIRIKWKSHGNYHQVSWMIEDTNDEHSILRIEESGFQGSEDEIIAQALDSTGGFNQVTIALKAYLEHGAIINVVTDHP